MTIQLDLYPADQERDERPCTQCGRMILTITTRSYVTSEYTDSEGRCWDCNRKVKR